MDELLCCYQIVLSLHKGYSTDSKNKKQHQKCLLQVMLLSYVILKTSKISFLRFLNGCLLSELVFLSV